MAKQRKPVPPEFFAFEVRPSFGKPWFGALVALWVAAVLAAYRPLHLPFLSPSAWLDGVPPVWLMSAASVRRHLGHLAILAAFTALCASLGRGLLRRAFKIEDLNPFETFSYGFGLGLSTLALATFALGAAQALRPAFVFATTAALVVLAVRLNYGLPASKDERASVLRDPACAALAMVAAYLLAFQCYHALAPEVSFDALVYHLGLPNLYRLSGGLVAAPAVAYSGFPALLDWAYCLMLFFSDDMSAKLIHWACAVGVAAALVGFGARLRRPLAGWVACVVFLGAPVTIYNTTKAAVDTGSAFFVLLAVASLALYLSRRETPGALELSAALCGLAMGVKYTNWPLLPLILLVLAAHDESRRALTRYGLVAFALVSPWILKNLALYHNPVFPFFTDAGARLRADAWGRNWSAVLADPRALIKVLLHPWFATIQGATEFDAIGPVFLIALAGLAWLRAASAESRAWLWVVAGLWLVWWTTTAMPRFFLPGLCLLSVFVGVTVERLPNWARAVAIALVCGLALDAAADFSAVTSQLGSREYLVDGASKEDYLKRSRLIYPASYYNAAEWIDRNAPASARVLLLNGGRGAYLNRPFLASSQLDDDLLARWLKGSGTADELYSIFRREGVTYLLVNMAWLWRSDPDRGVSPERARVLREFFDKYARRRYRDLERDPTAFRWVLVYEIGPGTGAPPKGIIPLVEWYQTGGASGLASHPNITIE